MKRRGGCAIAILLSFQVFILLFPGTTASAQQSTATYTQVVIKFVTGSGNIALVSSNSTASYTVPVTFTATVPAGATGTVAFKDGAITIGASTIAGNTAMFTTSILGVGVHSITAVYSGDANFSGATSGAITQTVTAADSLMLLAINSSPSPVGSPVTFTAQISTGGVAPSGSVFEFADGGTGIGTGSVSVVSTTNLLLYSNDLRTSAWQPSQASADGATVAGPTTNTLATSFTSSGISGSVSQLVGGLTPNAPVVLSAWLRISSGTQTVALTITDADSNVLATQGCSASPTWSRCSVTTTLGNAISSVIAKIGGLSNGVQAQVWGAQLESGSTPGPYVQTDGSAVAGSGATASLTLSNLNAGMHSITASYPGDAAVSTSMSAAGSLLVDKNESTAITLSSGTNPSKYKDAVTFTVTAAEAGGISPTGTITLLDGATTIGSGSLSSGSVQITTAALTAGDHSITAQYGGDSNFANTTSSVLTQAVHRLAGSIAVVTSSSPSTFGSAVTFTATVPSDASGTVTFTEGGTTLGTGAVLAGTATFSTSALLAGTSPHTITASWSGDSNYTAPASAQVSQVVNKAVLTSVGSMTIAGVPNPSSFGDTVTITITLAGVNGVVPTGTVSISDGATILNGAVAINPSGRATFTTSALDAGSHSISATYSGDSNYK